MVVTSDPDERALLVEATLRPFGYEVESAEDGGAGLSRVLQEPPDVLLLDLGVEGLSGQDVLAALNAQAVDLPVIVLADSGAEQDVLAAFRLGAKDYLTRPVREAEIVQAVERALKEVRLRRDREALVSDVQAAAQESERHLRELKTLMGIGKSVVAIRQPDEVFERVLRAALQLTRAETAGLFLRDPESGALIVQSGHNLSRNLIERMGQPIEDDLAALVMNSQEAYLGSGLGLEKFRPAQQGVSAVIYAPMVFQDQPIGVLWVANARLVFESYLKDIMTVLADYAAIAVADSRLFAAMDAHNEQLAAMNEALQERAAAAPAPAGGLSADLWRQLRRPLTELLGNMNLFRTGEMGRLAAGQQAAVDVMHRQLDSLIHMLDQLAPPEADI